MKYTVLLFLFLSHSLSAEILIHKYSKNASKKIKIEKLNGFHVNDVCIKHKQECLPLLKPAKVQQTKASGSGVLGNPASDFCQTHQGVSEILHDKKNNEYDYCLLKGKYLVDSWDFYSLNKND